MSKLRAQFGAKRHLLTTITQHITVNKDRTGTGAFVLTIRNGQGEMLPLDGSQYELVLTPSASSDWAPLAGANLGKVHTSPTVDFRTFPASIS